MAQGPETRLVALIRKAILQEYPDAWVIKVHGSPFQQAGLPDLFIVEAGRFIAIEVKALRPSETLAHALGRVTPVQHATLAAIRRAGGRTGVALSVAEALAIVAGQD